MSAFDSRAMTRFSAGVMIAAGIMAWSAPSDGRVRIFGHTSHFLPRGLHSRPFFYNSYPRSVVAHRSYVPYAYGTFCGVLSRHQCLPGFNYPIGQDLQLTIESRAENDMPETPEEPGNSDRAENDLDTIRQVFSALRACWNPPAKDVAQPGTQMTVRLSFNRYGGMISEPRVTYATPDISSDVRQVYWDAVSDTFKRCTPLKFTDGLGGALAGRPFAIRFVDNRSF